MPLSDDQAREYAASLGDVYTVEGDAVTIADLRHDLDKGELWAFVDGSRHNRWVPISTLYTAGEDLPEVPESFGITSSILANRESGWIDDRTVSADTAELSATLGQMIDAVNDYRQHGTYNAYAEAMADAWDRFVEIMRGN